MGVVPKVPGEELLPGNYINMGNFLSTMPGFVPRLGAADGGGDNRVTVLANTGTCRFSQVGRACRSGLGKADSAGADQLGLFNTLFGVGSC
jgi:hypothetical protein